MKGLPFIIILFFIFRHVLCEEKEEVNNRPIIGVPTMAITDKLLLKNVPKLEDRFYIAASYVKLIEMAGGRVVPIPSNFTDEQLENIARRVSGFLFTGGETNLEDSKYAQTTKKLFDIAIKQNNDGVVFPVLGICRGMQALMKHTVDSLDILKLTDARNYTTTLTWTEEAKESTSFKELPEDLYKAAENEPITSHFHKYGVNPKDFDASKELKDRFKILATSIDRKNIHFISAIEGVNMPFYGVQYHPEKVLFEWAETVNIPHSYTAVRFAQHAANTFVNQARKNTKNRFKNAKEERTYTISKTIPYYTGYMVDSHSPFVQIYLF